MKLLNQVKEANKLKALIKTFVYWRNMLSALPLFSFSCWMNCSKGRVRTLFPTMNKRKKKKNKNQKPSLPRLICPTVSLSCSESDDMVFEEFKRAYLKGVVYGDDDESPTEAWTTKTLTPRRIQFQCSDCWCECSWIETQSLVWAATLEGLHQLQSSRYHHLVCLGVFCLKKYISFYIW